MAGTPGRVEFANPRVTGTGVVVPRVQLTVEVRKFDDGVQVVLDRLRVSILDQDEFVARAASTLFTEVTTQGGDLTIEIPVSHSALAYVTDRLLGHKVNLVLRWAGVVAIGHPRAVPAAQRRPPQPEFAWQNLSFGGDESVDLPLQVSRSDWFKEVLEPVGFGEFVWAEIAIPSAELRAGWTAAVDHLRKADELYAKGDDPEVLARCYSALQALPGAPSDIVSGVANRAKRGALDDLLRKVTRLYHLGRHPDRLGDEPGAYPAGRMEALFALNMTKVVLAYLSDLPPPPDSSSSDPAASIK